MSRAGGDACGRRSRRDWKRGSPRLRSAGATLGPAANLVETLRPSQIRQRGDALPEASRALDARGDRRSGPAARGTIVVRENLSFADGFSTLEDDRMIAFAFVDRACIFDLSTSG